MKKVLFVTAVIIAALVIGVCTGIAYQKEQPVSLSVVTHSGQEILHEDTYTLTHNGALNLWPECDRKNVSVYHVTLKK